MLNWFRRPIQLHDHRNIACSGPWCVPESINRGFVNARKSSVYLDIFIQKQSLFGFSFFNNSMFRCETYKMVGIIGLLMLNLGNCRFNWLRSTWNLEKNILFLVYYWISIKVQQLWIIYLEKIEKFHICSPSFFIALNKIKFIGVRYTLLPEPTPSSLRSDIINSQFLRRELWL